MTKIKTNQKILIGIGVLAVIILLAWVPWITDECAIDKTVGKIGGQEAYYWIYGSGGGSIYDEFAVSWIPFGRFVTNYDNRWFVFFYECIIPEKKPKQITEEQAISIANATEEVREFLKLYPDAELEVSNSCGKLSAYFGSAIGYPCNESISVWVVSYWVLGQPMNPHAGLSGIKVSTGVIINSNSGEILKTYPELGYIKNSNYCRKDSDCLCRGCSGRADIRCCGCENFVHGAGYPFMLMYFSDGYCKCINNTCTTVEK